MHLNRPATVLLLATLLMSCGRESARRGAQKSTSTDTSGAVRRDAAATPTDKHARETDTTPEVGAVADSATAAPVLRLPPIQHVATPATIRALYVNRATTRGDGVWRLIDLARHSGVNALVFDVKDDQGRLLYPSTVGLAHLVGADTDQPMPVRRLHALMDSLRQYKLYSIARIVVGRDPVLVAHRPQWAVMHRAGDAERNAWLDPRHREIWAYAADLASEAVARGFSEVQFADVRFPDSHGEAELLELTSAKGVTRSQVIRDQLRYLDSRISVLTVPMAIDIDGLAAMDSSDLNTGQRWEMLADRADVLTPLMFPSRFPAGSFGIAQPSAQPGEIVGRALKAARQRTEVLRDAGQIVPWYQAFGAGTSPVVPAQVRAQIAAGEAEGFHSWMLWNPDSHYSAEMWHDSSQVTPPKPKTTPKATPKSGGKAGGKSGGKPTPKTTRKAGGKVTGRAGGQSRR